VSRPLGQHFLSDPAILDRIVAALTPEPTDLVLEIGPGEGTLTRRLAPRVAQVVAIEKDRRLVDALRDADPPLPGNVTVVEGDALEVDWAEAAERAVRAEESDRAIGCRPSAIGHRSKVVGNIPYYITSPLIEQALQPPLPAVIVYLVQREVADRVAAAPGGKTYGALTVGVQAVARAERLFVVRAGAFRPPPNVDSAVLRLTPLAEPLVREEERAAFRAFVVGLFGQRRKQITGGLRAVTTLDREGAVACCREAGIDPTARPETVPVRDFVRLFHVTPR
jgi:16S rRNA (adenine1518-N6/adenine1519-N6)-dimethyltransferase